MSNEALSWAWEQATPGPITKLILVHFADSAGKNSGESWYSVGTISKRCNCAENSVRTHIKKLIDLDLIRPVASGGGHQTNIYKINYTPSPRAGVQEVRGSGDAGGGFTTCSSGLHHVQGRPSPREAKPKVTINDPKLNPKNRKPKKVKHLDLPPWLDPGKWNDYVESRRSMKKHPMSVSALQLAITAIGKCVDDGHDCGDVLDAMTENGWRSVKAEWLNKRLQPAHDPALVQAQRIVARRKERERQRAQVVNE